jgi:prolyl 4-hydroxylase
MSQARMDQVRALLDAGREAEAIAIVRQEAAAGEAWGLFALAECKLAGQGMPRDPEGAVALLEQAGAIGWQPAAIRLITLYASGTGCPEQPAKAKQIVDMCRATSEIAEAQARVLEREPERADYSVEVLSESLDVTLLRGVLTAAECEWFATRAQPFLEPSFVEEPGTGKRIPHPVRTSKGMSFGPLQEDLVVNRVNRCIARLSGTEYGWGEPLHVLSYEPGEEYKPHFDALPGATNQRQATAILYLNDGYEGGETVFPELDLTVRGKAGDMLLFANLDAAGRRDDRSRHAGLPVTSGHKWIATRWIRQRRYHPWQPA